jgi:hypothetical protein
MPYGASSLISSKAVGLGRASQIIGNVAAPPGAWAWNGGTNGAVDVRAGGAVTLESFPSLDALEPDGQSGIACSFDLVPSSRIAGGTRVLECQPPRVNAVGVWRGVSDSQEITQATRRAVQSRKALINGLFFRETHAC